MTARILGFLLAFLVTVLAGAPAHALDIDITEFKLENGLSVVTVPDRRSPVVTHMIWYKVGAADEPKGKAGIAHFLEHLMFKGTPKHPAGEFSHLVRVNGGSENAFTTQDYTVYHQRIAKERLGLVMELEADRMQNLVLTDENVLPELLVVLEERRERIDNDPSSLLAEQVAAAMYTAHPYGKPIIGWMSEVLQLTRQDAVDFYRAHYEPANAILIVAGDVTADEVKALATKHYGGLKNLRDPQQRLRTPEPEPVAERRVIMKDERTAAAFWQRSYLAPAEVKAKGREALALEVFADIIGAGSRSRLYRKLVVEQKIASHVGAWYSGDELDYGSFGFYGTPNQGVELAAIEDAIDAVIADVLTNGVTQAELDTSRNRTIAESIYLLDNQEALARIVGNALVTGQSVRDVLDWERNFAAVTVEDVAAAAKAVLDKKNSVTGLLLPGGKGQGAPGIQPVVLDEIQNRGAMINLRTWLLQALILVLAASPALAFKIEEVTSPGGIKAWLVQDNAIPLIAMKFSFRGGSVFDPEGKEGVANFLTG
ncbi:MAG: insulinase family protein, partial [Rhizobiales bacterium]|nr:insulinase family protein [Hyphomicrobiales bacterium]